MFASAFAIIKWVLVLISGGALYQGFANNNNGNNNNTLAAKIAGAIVTTITMVAFASDASGLLGGLGGNQPTQTEAVKTEQLFWESVEKHPSEKLYRDYLKAYPEGKFKDIALAQLVSVAPPAPVVESKQQAAPAPTPSEPLQTAQAAEVPVSAAKPVEDWKTIDHYQVKGGLVRDTKTGLMWMRCSLGQTWDGSTCSGESTSYQWKEAMKFPSDFSYEGYSDWQVPSVEELETLIYCSTGKNPNPAAGGVCNDDSVKPTIMSEVFLQTSQYSVAWSSSRDTRTKMPYATSFRDGHSMYYNLNYDATESVRLVRYEVKPPVSAMIGQYQVNNGLVTDTKTGLMWMRCSAGQTWDGSMCQGQSVKVLYDNAKKMADELNYENYTDWRLPTQDELKTLIYCSSGKPVNRDEIHDSCEGDYTKPTIMRDVFPQTPYYWSSWSSYKDSVFHDAVASVDFSNGHSESYAGASNLEYTVRFVRNVK